MTSQSKHRKLRPRWKFPERATGAQRESASTWLTIIEPHIGSFQASFALDDQDLEVTVRGDAGGKGVVRVTPDGVVIAAATGRRVAL